MKRRVLILPFALALAACGGTSDVDRAEEAAPSTTPATSTTPAPAAGGIAAASCVGPYLDDQPPTGVPGAPTPTVAPGASVTIYGHWYTSTCNDSMMEGEVGESPQPLAPVRLTLALPDGTTKVLGRFTPSGADSGFSTTVEIPEGTDAGTATVADGRADGARYAFSIGQARRGTCDEFGRTFTELGHAQEYYDPTHRTLEIDTEGTTYVLSLDDAECLARYPLVEKVLSAVERRERATR